MSLIIILVCLGIQRYLKLNSYSHQVNWVEPYFKWMTAKVEQITKGHGFIGVAILVLPVLIGVAIIFALVYNLLGTIGYMVLSIVLVWYCMDGRDARREPYENMTTQALFITTYRNLFGVLFWYALFGPVGLSLYITVSKLQNFIAKQPLVLPEGSDVSLPKESDTSLNRCMNKTLGVLDWVPVRLVGLSYALVGHFGLVFKSWLKKLLRGVSNTQELVAEWGMIALKQVSTSDTSAGATQAAANIQQTEAIALIDRSLLVWLIAILLVTFGFLLG